MSDETKDQDVNTDGVDNVTDDHNAGLGSSAEDMETHNPDIADYDKAIADMDADDDDTDDASGGTKKTDDSDDTDVDASDADDKDKDKDVDDVDEPKIPRSRLNEVIAKGEDAAKVHHAREVEWARKEAIFEGRLAALEKPVEDAAPVVDPLDEILKGEPQAVLDRFTEDPAAFVRMIQSQAKAETTMSVQKQREEEAYNTSLTTELDKFRDEHDDFMPNAPKLVEIMNTNPIHNVISAYAYEFQIPALKSQLEEVTKGTDDKVAAAKAEGIVEGKKEAIKEIQAKGSATVLDGGGSVQTGGKANAGSDLNTGGDPVKLREKLTADLLKRRAAQG
jgi:hypothetical protein